MALIFMLTREGRMYAGLGRQVWSGGCDGLMTASWPAPLGAQHAGVPARQVRLSRILRSVLDNRRRTVGLAAPPARRTDSRLALARPTGGALLAAIVRCFAALVTRRVVLQTGRTSCHQLHIDQQSSKRIWVLNHSLNGTAIE